MVFEHRAQSLQRLGERVPRIVVSSGSGTDRLARVGSIVIGIPSSMAALVRDFVPGLVFQPFGLIWTKPTEEGECHLPNS